MSGFPGESIDVALKEWSAVVGALRDGRQTVLLRKGGIHESGGEFEIEHRQFLLFPTHVHQKPDLVVPAEHRRLDIRAAEPTQLKIDTAASIAQIIPLHDRGLMAGLDRYHIWSPALIEMRFAYKPHNPLYLLIVRAYRLSIPEVIENEPRYAGCKSWVTLTPPMAINGEAVIDDQAFENMRCAIMQSVSR